MKPYSESIKKIIFKKSNLFWILLPWVVVLVFFIFYYQSPLYIIHPEIEFEVQKIHVGNFTDKNNNGNSEIAIVKNTSHEIVFKYTLKEGYQFKYANIFYFFSDSSGIDTSRFLDLSPYDYLKVKIKAEKGTRIGTSIWYYVDGFSTMKNFLTLRPAGSILNVNKEYQEITVNMKDLYTTDWWYSQLNVKESDFGPHDFSKSESLFFSNCLNIPLNTEDTVSIKEVSFHVSLTPFYIYSGLFLVLYYSVAGWVGYKKNNIGKPEINFDFENSENIQYQNKEEEAIFKFITSNYSNVSLGVLEVKEAVQLSEQQIAGTIRNKTGLNLRQFLNRLRVTEAKRLLAMADLQVSEIAFKVGFSNVSHFSRVFKEIENCTPLDYRKLSISKKNTLRT